jgi:hypothetical protein
MSDLTLLEAQVAALLQDTAAVAWTTPEIDAAIRLALAEYSRVIPVVTETVITLTTTGREIVLSSSTLTGIVYVLEVWWPWFTTGGEVWPPNRVAGFQLRENAGVLTLFLSAIDGSQPKAGDKVRLWWTKPQTVNTLDGAVATTLTTEGKAVVSLGAAGYAAASGTLDRSEVLDIEVLRKWGNSMLTEFRSKLEKVRAETTRTKGDPFGRGWSLDKWDVQQ